MLLAVILIMVAGVLLAAGRQLLVPFLVAGLVAWAWVEFSGPSPPRVANYSKPRNDRVKTYVLKEPTTVGCDNLGALKGVLADAQTARSKEEQEKNLLAANCRLVTNSPSLWWDLHGIEDNGKFLKLSSLGDGPILVYKAEDFALR